LSRALAAVQGVWVALTTPRLPEAAGPRQGQAGRGAPLRLLIAGDSSAAGVGVIDQGAALSGQLVAGLAGDFVLDWRLVARTGATTSATLNHLRRTPPPPCDVAVLALGVNDVLRQVPLARWLDSYAALAGHLTGALGARLVLASGVPPMAVFPALPRTLARHLGARADRFDAALADLCQSTPGLRHVPFEGRALNPSLMASDGFHPGAGLYRLWAQTLSREIRDHYRSHA
jgi:lysophospholipase L1-like esterase